MKRFVLFSGLLGAALAGAGLVLKGKRGSRSVAPAAPQNEERRNREGVNDGLPALAEGESIVGRDEKGRILYMGKRGGQFYKTARGTVEYISKDRAQRNA